MVGLKLSGGPKTHRFQINEELVKILFRTQSLHLIDVIRIGQVIVGVGDKNGCTKTAGGRVSDTGRIANATRAETPIVRMICGIRENFLIGGKTVR